MSAWQRSAATGAAILIGIAVLSATGEAQGRARSQGIPPGMMPPPGQCRVWYSGVAPGHQPAPMSCDRAREMARRSTGARIIYGGSTGGDVEMRRRRDDRDADDRRRSDADDRRRTDERDVPWYSRSRVGRSRYPSRLPLMRWGADYAHGERSNDARSWVGPDILRASLSDVNRDGVPEIVTWYDLNGRPVQRWFDQNRDGRADRVLIYQNGRIVQDIR